MSSRIVANIYPLEGRDLSLISRDEIMESISIAPEIRWCEGAASLARITSSVIVKWGRHIHLSEAPNMQYVAEHTKICLPNVIDAWEVEDATEDDEFNTCYIVMEYINGKLLIDIWDELDEIARRGIQSQIYEYTCELQNLNLETPGPIGGGISEGALSLGMELAHLNLPTTWKSGITAVFLYATTMVTLRIYYLGRFPGSSISW